MIYNNLPTTDTSVSKACLGTMSFGAHVDEPTAIDVMNRALELDINFFDTAEMYAVPPCPETYGHTEAIIGRWMKQENTRDKIVLATKVVGPTRGMSWIRDGKTTFNEKYIREALEESLKRLQTDHIDLYQLHWPDRNIQIFGGRYFENSQVELGTDIAETLTVLQKLQQEGKVKHFGLSNETPWGTMKFLQTAEQYNLPRMVTVQNNYSLLTRTYDMAMAEISLQEDIGLLAYSPLAYGVLGGNSLDGKTRPGGRLEKYPDFVPRYRTPQVEASIKRYKALAEDNGMTLPELALAFVYQRPFMTSNIIGPSDIEQLESCVKALEFKITPEILAEINAIDAILPNPCA